MNKIRIGVISPSEIAFRRFMPAILNHDSFEYVGVAYPTSDEWDNASVSQLDLEINKAKDFMKEYGGNIYEGYKSVISDPSIDAIYLPLPPALHYKWAKLALENNKHVFLEKPSTTNEKDTLELVELANSKSLALHENYMFQYHNQIDLLKELIDTKEVGETRLIRTNFGFPKRLSNDFRYNKDLGGGALLDCGGYPLRLMSKLMEHDLEVIASKLVYNENDIDLFGSVMLTNSDVIGQVSFGMDNAYKCDIEVWGSNGTIYTGRVFTAPEGFETSIVINKNNQESTISVRGDDTFYKSIDKFYKCITDDNIRELEYKELLTQIRLVEEVRKEGK
ncbi:Gfo/Idh/MocA family protein [Tannockella kyphosi]|uniref:Gfo/Idh/MocA family protein n=1 Tax=Tannockella kyphosi TaxID=2899121 RepID=UPI002011D333|nr:Gfo/Idh/MocA family oxidoreductase [Tannockella kyphosi]